MADMFGAPIGQSQAETDMRQEVSGALAAQKTLGEIAMQPVEAQLKQAHAKLYGAEAEQKLAALDAAKKLDELQRGFFTQQQASQGQIATVDGFEKAKAGTDYDPANNLRKFLQYAEKQGTPESTLMAFKKELATIEKDHAVSAYDTARAAEQQQLTVKAKASRMASWATAALQDPSQYPRLLQQALNNPDPEISKGASQLPTTWGPATARVMESLRVAGIDAAKMAELQIQQAKEKSTLALQSAQTSNANARTSLANVRTDLEKAKLGIVTKYGGETAQATLDQKKTTVAAKKDAAGALYDKAYPELPLNFDAKTARAGAGYTIKGKPYHYIGNDAQGKARFEPANATDVRKTLNTVAPSSSDNFDAGGE